MGGFLSSVSHISQILCQIASSEFFFFLYIIKFADGDLAQKFYLLKKAVFIVWFCEKKEKLLDSISKGQLISKANFEVFIWTKKTNENIFVFLPILEN